jgi:hypothetical protein
MYEHADPAKLVRALIGEAPHGQAAPEGTSILPRGCTVTVSRDCCSNGEEIARRLAARVGVRCFDRELLDAMVRETQVDPMLLDQLDERVSGMMDDVVRGLFSGDHFGAEKFRSSLVRVVLGISSAGGVIVGRGTNLILKHRKVYRVRIVGSPLMCARRLAEQENVSVEVALQRVQTVNTERAEFIRYHFEQNINTPSNYDLMLNTDALGVDDAVRVITFSMQTAGFIVPAAAGVSR